ncbi:MAG: S-layer homology domain-containing protein [Hominicoprocola sp.]
MKVKTKLHKLLSLLLCCVMLVGLLPTTALADGDYEDGENCPYCGSYNWGDWKCDGCGGCSADSGRTACYEEHHCQDCGKCLWEDDEYCESCLTCWTCAEQDGTHCQWCRAESFDICSECGFCEDCIEELDLHCGDCNDCLGEAFNDCDKDHPGDKTLHCTGCAEDWVCGNCDRCFFNDQDMFCKDCGNCLDCQAGGAHCLHCGKCVASEGGDVDGAYDEFGYTFCYDCLKEVGWICEECDEFTGQDEWCDWCGEETHCRECAQEFICLACEQCILGLGVEFCDECGWCEECCQADTAEKGCVHDYCTESSDYDDHLCSECGECPGDEDPCEYCGRCETCAADYHCDHELCPEGAEYLDEDHYCEGCDQCYDFGEICEFCHLCFECAETETHCSCGYCAEGDPDYEDESHKCQGCDNLSCEGYDICEYCGLCEDCAEGDTHCECGENVCVESPDWEDHYCVNCEQCPEGERCAYCGMCETCIENEGYHCVHGVCPDDPAGCDQCVACTHVYTADPAGNNAHGHWSVCVNCGKRGDMEDHTPQLVTVTAPDAATKTNGEGKYVCEDCGWIIETGVVIPYEVPAHTHEYGATGLCTICGKRCETMWFVRQPKDITVTVPDVGLEEQVGMTATFSVKPRDAKGHTEEDFDYYWEAGYVKADGTCDFHEVEGSSLVPEEIKDSNPGYFEQSTLIISVPTDICCYNIRVRCLVGLYNEETDDYDYEMYSGEATLIGKHSYKYQALEDGGSKYIPMTPGGSDVIYGTSAQHQKICVGESCYETLGAAAPHNYNGWLWKYAATTEHTGLKYRVCKDCGYRDFVVTPKLDASHVHNFVYKYNDTVHWQECSGCGAKQVLDKDGNPVIFPEGMVPANSVYQSSHVYGDWVRTTEPTEDATGEDTATCKVCGYEIYRDVDKLAHTHAFYTYDEYFQYAFVEAVAGWHVTNDAKGNPASGDFYYTGEKVLGGDETGHWFYCKGEMCEQKGYLHPHRMSAWNVVAVPTATEEGAAYGECLDCGFWSTRSIPAGGYPIGVQNGESFDADGNPVASGTVGQTITIKASQVEGKKFDHWEVMSGGVILANANAKETTFVVKSITPAHDPALLKDYTINIYGAFTACTHTSTHTGGAIAPTCGANGKTADTICDECGAVVTAGTPIDATGEHDFQIDPKTVKTGDCTHTGYSGDYVCTVCGRKGETGTRTGRYHANTETTGAKEPTCTVVGYTGTTVCTDCGAIVSKGEKIDKTSHSFSEWAETTAPTFDKAGKETRTCALCGKTETRTIPATGTYTVKFNSNGGSAVTAQSVAPNATAVRPADPSKSESKFTGWYSNKVLTKAYDFATPVTANLTLYAKWEETSVVPEPEEYTVTVKNSYASTTGEGTYAPGQTVTIHAGSRSGYTFDGWTSSDVSITDADNENASFVMPDQAVTVTANWTYTGSSSGGGSGVTTYAITVESAKNGDVTADHKSAAKGTTVTLTVEPDKGYTLETLTVTDRSGDEIELTDKGNGKYTFKMPASKVYVEATFMEDNSMLNFFVDVFPGDYYYDAVLWAAKNGITGGVDDTHFAPNATCTRAQAVTFLWRAAGSPAPKSSTMPFTDVKTGSYYETAVLWAVENGITNGTGDTTFSPNATCTRGQIVSFLWRALGSRAVSGSAVFTDVKTGSYYETAVLWAVENGITNGTGNNAFSPNADCTRAQIVSFLFRCLGK